MLKVRLQGSFHFRLELKLLGYQQSVQFREVALGNRGAELFIAFSSLNKYVDSL
jgi:hypothetical protein